MILKLSSPEIDWTASSTPLSGLPEDVLKVTLHYLYAECLPRGLSESTAQKCCKLVGKLPGFAKFGQLCETFLKNTALTQRKLYLVLNKDLILHCLNNYMQLIFLILF